MYEIAKNYIYNFQLNLNARTTVMKVKVKNKQLIKIDQQSTGKCSTRFKNLNRGRVSYVI